MFMEYLLHAEHFGGCCKDTLNLFFCILALSSSTRIEPVSPAGEVGVVTTGPPRQSLDAVKTERGLRSGLSPQQCGGDKIV